MIHGEEGRTVITRIDKTGSALTGVSAEVMLIT
jgi:hypothetical protein